MYVCIYIEARVRRAHLQRLARRVHRRVPRHLFMYIYIYIYTYTYIYIYVHI